VANRLDDAIRPHVSGVTPVRIDNETGGERNRDVTPPAKPPEEACWSTLTRGAIGMNYG
jgi:hypothetical protein